MESSLNFLAFFISAFLLSASTFVQAEELSTFKVEKDALTFLKRKLGNHPAFENWVKYDNMTVCQAAWSFIGCENGVVTKLLFSNDDFAAKNASWKLGAVPGALSGDFPWRAVLLLRNLKVINLKGNRLTGSALPFDIGSLESLEELRLSKNNFTGEIPNDVTTLVNLTALDLSENYVEGEIPYDIYKLTNLQILNLGSNRLSSSLPNSLGYIYSLERLNLANNQLQGVIPSMSNLYNLIFLELQNNLLLGTLPENINNATTLYHFDVSFNNLFGEFPKTLINHPTLKTIRLNRNSFSGPIPDSILSSPVLTTVDISNNFFNLTLSQDNQMIKMDGNCLSNKANQRLSAECVEFYTPIVLFE